MMELQQQIVNDLYAKENEDKTVQEQTSTGVTYRSVVVEHNFQGRNLFTHEFAQSIHEVYVNDYHKVKVLGFGGVMEKKGFSQYELYYTPTLFDHYFRHFYTILKFIDKEDIPETDKRIFSDEELYGYAKILRATLSRFELVWLYYNGLSGYGNKKLKPLIEKYCMLKNLREDLLVCCKENQDALEKIGVTLKDVSGNGYSGTDYEFFLTTERNDQSKYHYSAFYKSLEEQNECIKKIFQWNTYLDDKKRQAEALAARSTKTNASEDDLLKFP